MLSRRTQTKEDQKQLWLPLGAVGGFIMMLVLGMLAGNLAAAGGVDLLTLAEAGSLSVFARTMQAWLSDQAQFMGLPLADGSQAYWYVARAGGVVSYLLLWLATCWGIMMSSKIAKGYINSSRLYTLHQFLPILGIVFAGLHALVLLGDSYIGFEIWQLLLPFTSTYEPLWTGLGSLAFYLFLALIISSYLRKQMGQGSWRALHYASYLAFLLALLHGLMAGTDSEAWAMRVLYVTTGGSALFLVYYRMLAYKPRESRSLGP